MSEQRRRPRARADSGRAETPAPTPPTPRWYRADLHIHTPGSIDYQEPGIRPIDLLRTAAEQSLDIIALTDHNAVGGWSRLKHEIEDLGYLERLGRITADEQSLLDEYRDLMGKVLVLPGLEFTATFGFHILAVFDPTTSIRLMEHLLLLLGVPEDRFGSGEVGSTSDVLKAYEVLAENGGIVIGAHVNSTHGVAMRNIKFGGQTKIAYTQDKNLHALEVTDLTSTSARSTARFFNGSKSEYARRMHCIQGSDAHRLHTDPARPVNLGIGDRATEFFLADRTFAALKNCLISTEWDHVRPARAGGPAASAIDSLRTEGVTAQTAFHEKLPTAARGNLTGVVRDVAAFANGEGGTILIGVGPAARKVIPGVTNADEVIRSLNQAIQTEIEPPCPVTIESIPYEGKTVISIRVAPGTERPYAVASGEIPVRRGTETTHARRDEIMQLVRGQAIAPVAAEPPTRPTATAEDTRPAKATPKTRTQSRSRSTRAEQSTVETGPRQAPRNGVEIVEVVEVDGVAHYTMRDLRNDQLTRNVTAATARSLWAQAIREYEKTPPTEDRIQWRGNHGFWKSTRISNGERRYHVALRGPDGSLRIFFGVSEDGLDERWREIVPVSGPIHSEASEVAVPV